MAMSSLTYIPFFFCEIFSSVDLYWMIMQIRHILIKDHIWIFSSETSKPN